MALLVRAFPLNRPVEELKAFAAAVTARKAEADAFYRQLHVTHESWHLQETPHGPWVIAVAKVADPVETGKHHATSAGPFDVWFKEQVQRLSGVDPSREPLGPLTTQVFAWSDEAQAGSNLCE